MIHGAIKELARRSMSYDRVLFGESNTQRHPLGFDGFIVDATVDRALLQLNSSTYDSATSLGLECEGLARLLKESIDVNVSTPIARMYKESKVGEVFKKVIAYIKKALKYLFVELPKKIYNRVKSFFTKKKDSTGMAKKTEENIKKTEESLKAVHEEIKSKVNSPEFEAWRNEMLGELDGVKTRMEATSNAEAERATDDVINMAKKVRAEKDANMRVVSGEYDDVHTTETKIKGTTNNLNEFSDKTNKAIKNAAKKYSNTINVGNEEFASGLKNIDDIGKELDELLNSMNNDPRYDNANIMKYRDAELKMMADTLLTSLENGKAKLHPSFSHDISYFVNAYMPLISADPRNEWGYSDDQFSVFIMTMLVRSVDAIPYTTPTLAKYFKEKFKVEVFNPFSTAAMASKPSAAVAYMCDQLKSVNRLCGSLDMPSMPTFDAEVFNEKYIDSFTRAIRSNGDEDRISLDALNSISQEMTITLKKADVNTLTNLEKHYDALYKAVENMSTSVMFMKGMTFEDVAEYIGVEAKTASTEQINEGMANILDLIKVVTDATQKIAVASIRCMVSLVSAEEKVIKFVVSNDDFVSSITMSKLAHFMSHDMPSYRRAMKIVHAL